MVETDSSYIEFTKNANYKYVEETYKEHDSIFKQVFYLSDTNQLKSSHWEKDNGGRFGKKTEYREGGTWIYTINYDSLVWQYNKDLFNFQDLKDSMKRAADTLLIEKFGMEFFRENLQFEFEGYTYKWELENYRTGRFYERKKLGAWTEPIYQKPEGYIIRYTIGLSPTEKFRNYLTIELDSVGVPVSDTNQEALNLEDRQRPFRTPMSITKPVAIALCQGRLQHASEYEYEATLKYGWRKDGPYPGEFYYEVVQLYDEEQDSLSATDAALARYYNVWRINPWTSELFFIEQMKIIVKSSSGQPITGNLIGLED